MRGTFLGICVPPREGESGAAGRKEGAFSPIHIDIRLLDMNIAQKNELVYRFFVNNSKKACPGGHAFYRGIIACSVS